MFQEYKARKYSRRFLAEHEADIELYRAACADFKRILDGAKPTKVDELKEESRKPSLDKLQVLRVYLYKNNSNLVNNVFMNYITVSYHIEANEMMSLNEKIFNLIPNYVMNICDSIMEKNKVESVKKVKVNA